MWIQKYNLSLLLLTWTQYTVCVLALMKDTIWIYQSIFSELNKKRCPIWTLRLKLVMCLMFLRPLHSFVCKCVREREQKKHMLKYSARDYIVSSKQPASQWLNPRLLRGRFNISWLCTRKRWIENIHMRLENALARKCGGSSRLVNPSIIQTRGLKVWTCKREELKTEPPQPACARCFFTCWSQTNIFTQRTILCSLVACQCCCHFFGLKSWNTGCSGSHMKSRLWTEKPCEFEARCHCLCILAASREHNLVYFHLTKVWVSPGYFFFYISQPCIFGIFSLSYSGSWVCLWINNNHWQEHWMLPR